MCKWDIKCVRTPAHMVRTACEPRRLPPGQGHLAVLAHLISMLAWLGSEGGTLSSGPPYGPSFVLLPLGASSLGASCVPFPSARAACRCPSPPLTGDGVEAQRLSGYHAGKLGFELRSVGLLSHPTAPRSLSPDRSSILTRRASTPGCVCDRPIAPRGTSYRI